MDHEHGKRASIDFLSFAVLVACFGPDPYVVAVVQGGRCVAILCVEDVIVFVDEAGCELDRVLVLLCPSAVVFIVERSVFVGGGCDVFVSSVLFWCVGCDA
jgi:hypothetical protein